MLVDLLKIGGIGALVVGAIFLLFREPLRRIVFPNIPARQASLIIISILFCLWSLGMAALILGSIRCNDPPPVIACKSPFPPSVMQEVETDWEQVDHHGLWYYDPNNRSFMANWGNVSAIISVRNLPNGVFSFYRVDKNAAPGFTASYLGSVLPDVQKDGMCRIEGTVVWNPSSTEETRGRWFGTWPAAAYSNASRAELPSNHPITPTP